jgi:hypothetical protein
LLVVNSIDGSAAFNSSSVICSAVFGRPAVLLLLPAEKGSGETNTWAEYPCWLMYSPANNSFMVVSQACQQQYVPGAASDPTCAAETPGFGQPAALRLLHELL